ncbi:MAG: hypothetical protein JRN10_04770 [Nitrososphaerota archaeon]|jgi:hypothetical protein|nr:hypothetical protein [Nitrososphaerota archaeon]MDG6930537.1 hypothetical protein [Nitrososphaerota archaeon]
MTDIESLPWKPLKATNEAYERAEIVDHSSVPFEIQCLFYGEPTRLIKGMWYYYQRISGDIIRAPYPIDWRTHHDFPSEEFVMSATLDSEPPVCQLCGAAFTKGKNGYYANIHVVGGRITGYLCDICDETYMQALPHYTSKTYPRIADKVLRLVEVAQE